MKNNQEYIYSLPNTSCTLRTVAHLRHKHHSHLNSVAAINLIDRWLIRLRLNKNTPCQQIKNLAAFLAEMGSIYQPSTRILQAINSLDRGESPTKVMNRYRVVIVAYGEPETREIEIFRDRVIEGLGYCPQNMA
ncbi:MAG: hypothetical protein AAFO76_07540 [Cyanobacteria bacterium J06607_15]